MPTIKAAYKVAGFPGHAKFVNGSPVADGQELMLYPEVAACYPFLVPMAPMALQVERAPNPGAAEAIKPRPLAPRNRPGGGITVGGAGMVTAGDTKGGAAGA
jgi:hypothetical protein